MSEYATRQVTLEERKEWVVTEAIRRAPKNGVRIPVARGTARGLGLKAKLPLKVINALADEVARRMEEPC